MAAEHHNPIARQPKALTFLIVMAAGLLVTGGATSAQAGYQVGTAVVVQAPVNLGGQCSYNFANINSNGGCSAISAGFTGSVTPATSPPNNSGAATAATASVSGSSTGSASVYLSTASAHLYASTVPGGVVAEYGNYSDTLHYTVAGANAATVTPIGFTVTIDGSMQGVGQGALVGQVDYGTDDARFNLVLNASTGNQTAIGYLDTYPSGAPGTWTHNAALTQFTYTDTLDVIGASGSFPLSLSSQLICEDGVICDYANTLQTALSYSSNVSFTSDSGVFPTQAPSPIPTPEPGTLGLLAFSMAGIAFYRRRRLH